MLHKEGKDHAQVVDAMFGEAIDGRDYTELIKMDGDVRRQPQNPDALYNNAPTVMFGKDIGTDPTVQAFYSQLLGPSFGLEENQFIFMKALEKINPNADEIFTNDVIGQVLTEMHRMNDNALATAAISGRPKFGKGLKPDQVDVTAAKIAFAADTTRQIRVRKVISEVMPEGNINLRFYEDAFRREGLDPNMAKSAIEARATELIGNKTDPGLTPEMRKIVDRPGTQLANYIYGARQQAKGLGYNDELLEALAPEMAKLYDRGDGMATFSKDQKQLTDIIYGDPSTKQTIVKNLTRLRRASPDLQQYLGQIYDYNIALRKRLISGQLGGLAMGNSIYHAENFATAPMIASVTAPEYISTVIGQQARTPYKLAMQQRMPAVADDVLMGEAGLKRFVTGQTKEGTSMIGNYTVEEAIDAYRTKNLGSTQRSLHLDDNFVADVAAMAGRYGLDDKTAVFGGLNLKKGFIAPGEGTTTAMQFADSTDRMFREAVFFEALARGKTPEQAAQLAREVLLDYGAMPGVAKDYIGKVFLYMSFTYMMGKEVTLSMASPTRFRMLTAQLNYHRKKSEEIFGQQTELTDHVLAFKLEQPMEKDASAYAVYFRNPIIGSFGQVSSVADSVRQAQISNAMMKEAAKMPQKAGLDGIMDIGYAPFLDLLKTAQMEYKKPLPEKVVYQISAIPTSGPLSGPAAKEMFDLEYVKVDRRIPGKAEMGVDRYYVDPSTGMRHKMDINELERGIDLDGDGVVDASKGDIEGRGGYQLRFKSAEGYGKFVAMQQFLQFGGYGRLMNDMTGAMIAAGALPEGTTFGYSEKGNPVFYLLGREKIIRVPKQMEKYDRQVRQYERDLIEFMEGYD